MISHDPTKIGKTMKDYRLFPIYIFLFLVSIFSTLCFSQESTDVKQKNIVFYGKEYFLLEGTEIADSLKENRYDRLPISYKQIVRKPVWELSKSSAGLSIRFLSNSTNIKVKWDILNNTKMSHMAETGIKGVDLYFKNDKKWQYVNTAKPYGKKNEASLVSNMTNDMREYKMFLPLYDGVVNIEVGIDSNSIIKKSIKNEHKPIVFYGTSITQGGCASRPGMVHTNIISRKLNVDCINFGFSGNGRMEQSIGELISEINASLYVIECLPNMNQNQVTNRTIPLVKIIRKKHPVTPIIFVENFIYKQMSLDKKMRDIISNKNSALKVEYNKMKENDIKNIYYLKSEDALGSEGTVDGVHFTDLGYMNYANYLLEKFDQLGITF